MLPKVRVIGFSAEHSGAVQFFLLIFDLTRLNLLPNRNRRCAMESSTILMGGWVKIVPEYTLNKTTE